MKKIIKTLILSLLIGIICGSSGSENIAVQPQVPDDTHDIPQPESRDIDLYTYAIDKLFAMPLRRTFELSRLLRKLSGNPKQALNTDAYDKAVDSSWFTIRNALQPLTLEEIRRGPDSSGQLGPDTTGKWTIVRAKAEGITPGFTIRDSSGNYFIIKFDPPGYSELATGAEVVSTKLFYAAGFHVPENNITIFHPDILVMGEEVKFTDKKGNERFMNHDDLEDILERIHYLPDGRIRALASKYIEGIPLGPFRYEGTRGDDPNDMIPHEHRRELRGLRIICAWLNHFDTKAGNSFDAYVTDNGRKYVRHYLMDFGSTLGSAAHGPVPLHVGTEYVVDVKRILINYLSLGLYRYPFEKAGNQEITYPSIGYYTSEVFRPWDYKPNMPNPAFLNMTNRDGLWAAGIVMSFSDEQLKAAVDQGQYSDPEAAGFLLRVLKERRDIIGRYWFGLMNPLDTFSIREKAGNQELSFTDMAVRAGFEQQAAASYTYRINNYETGKTITKGTVSSTSIPLLEISALSGDVCDVTIKTKRGANGGWSTWIKVFLQPDKYNDRYKLLGISREE
ncbi:hypothetical protein ACFL30_01600 [Candidatus Latescibacterota bacterium]